MIPETLPIAIAAAYAAWRYFNILEARTPKPTKSVVELETELAKLRADFEETKNKITSLTLATAAGRPLYQKRG